MTCKDLSWKVKTQLFTYRYVLRSCRPPLELIYQNVVFGDMWQADACGYVPVQPVPGVWNILNYYSRQIDMTTTHNLTLIT